MKKTFKTIIILLSAVLMLFTSCNDKLQRLEEGSVNEYIYPYLKFQKAEDGESVTAIVVDGAKLNTVKIPAYVEDLKVNSFIGFENSEDAKSVKEILIGSHETVIADDALKQAINLEKVKVDRNPDIQFWGKLPVLEKDGYGFVGWYAGDELIYDGMMIDPVHPVAEPVWMAHEYVHHEGKSATCTSSGTREYWQCSICNKKFATSEGKLSDIITDVEIPKLNHELVYHELLKPTCTVPGTRAHYECSICHQKFSDENGKYPIDSIMIPTSSHDLVFKPEVPATCQEVGYRAFYVCRNCDQKFEDKDGNIPVTGSLVIDKLDHLFEDKWTNDDSYHWHYCSLCHKEKSDYAPHDHNRKVITKQPSPGEIGEYVMKCECGHETDPIPMTEDDHNLGILAEKKPTCTEDGWITYYCMDEGCKFTYTVTVPKLNHKNSYEVKAKTPTCTEDGNVYHWHCEDCGLDYTDGTFTETISNVVLDKLGHDFTGKYYDDGNGKHYQKCSRCDAEGIHEAHEYNLPEKLPNDLNLYHGATCTEPAEYYKTCKCGDFKADVNNVFSDGEPLGHILVKVPAKPSTCTVQGNIEYWKCTRYEPNSFFRDENATDPLDETEILLPLAPHVYAGEAYRVAAEGHYPICDVCGQEGPFEKHNRDAWNHDSEQHWKVCSKCGQVMTARENHNWAIAANDDRYCIDCGFVQGKSTEGGGFDVDEEIRTPSGTMESSHVGNMWTFRFINGNANYKPDRIEWYVNDIKQAETSDTFVLHADRPRSYTVMCVYINKYGAGSSSETITGENDK